MNKQSRPMGDSFRPGNDQGVRFGRTVDAIDRDEWGEVILAVTHDLAAMTPSTLTVSAMAKFRNYNADREVVLVRFAGGYAIIGGEC